MDTIETYWNDDEFRILTPEDEVGKNELKKALSKIVRDDKNYVFFDLFPFSHQKEILEDLRLEREEYESYKNLVVAATGGERVIIVMGAINALVSRFSGTFIEKNHALLRAIRYNCCKQCMREKDLSYFINYDHIKIIVSYR